jgi:dienelactone hydrolase
VAGLRERFASGLRSAAVSLRPLGRGGRVARGSALGIAALTGAVLAAQASLIVLTSAPNLRGLLPFLALALLIGAVAGAVVLAVRIAALVDGILVWAVLAALYALPLLPSLLNPLGLVGRAAVGGVLVVLGGLLGTGISTLRRPAAGSEPAPRRRHAGAAVLLGAVLLAAAIGWLAWDGPGRGPAPPDARSMTPGQPPPLNLPNPSAAGHFAVTTFTYGSGSDRHRPEYGTAVDLKTRPVAASGVAGWTGLVGWARTAYWGFDTRALPLQGRVWYPKTDTPRPLVVFLHGNHVGEAFSDDGFAYLTSLLASRGFIAVSIDENFLNFSAVDLLDPELSFARQRDLRAWLLLEHLRQWRDWNRDPESPFHGRVDMDRIALVGHSLGGEAVALAAAMNALPRDPDDALRPADYGFGIRAVAALAPTDDVARPGGEPTRLRDLSYFVMHGVEDAQVDSFRGSRLFQRVDLGGGGSHFKAGLYIEGANHSQFNSSWGRSDLAGLENAFLNRAAYISPDEQRQIARVYLSAFLEAALDGETGYRALFRDHRAAPAGWLPDLVYLHQYLDSSTLRVSTHEEDIDATTTTLPGGRISAEHLRYWREAPVELRWGTLGTRVAYLGWDRAAAQGTPAYAVELPSGLDPGPKSVLTFHLADGVPGGHEPLDLTLEVCDRSGSAARLPLSHVARLQPRLPRHLLKAAWMSNAPRSEVVFQEFSFPLADFAAAGDGFDPAGLRRVRFVFDRTPAGTVLLDDLGFRPRD